MVSGLDGLARPSSIFLPYSPRLPPVPPSLLVSSLPNPLSLSVTAVAPPLSLPLAVTPPATVAGGGSAFPLAGAVPLAGAGPAAVRHHRLRAPQEVIHAHVVVVQAGGQGPWAGGALVFPVGLVVGPQGSPCTLGGIGVVVVGGRG